VVSTTGAARDRQHRNADKEGEAGSHHTLSIGSDCRRAEIRIQLRRYCRSGMLRTP